MFQKLHIWIWDKYAGIKTKTFRWVWTHSNDSRDAKFVDWSLIKSKKIVCQLVTFQCREVRLRDKTGWRISPKWIIPLIGPGVYNSMLPKLSYAGFNEDGNEPSDLTKETQYFGILMSVRFARRALFQVISFYVKIMVFTTVLLRLFPSGV